MVKADSQDVVNAAVIGREPMIQPTKLKSNNKSHSELLEKSKASNGLVNEAETPTFTPKRKLKFNQKIELCENLEKINKGVVAARKLTTEAPVASSLLSFENGVSQIGGGSDKATPSSTSSGTAWWQTIT